MRVVLTNNEGACGIGLSAAMLAEGHAVLDALEKGVRAVEASPDVWTVGRGGWPNLLGEVELDASVMDGDGLRSGAVGSVRGFLHPVSVARRVLEELPHEILVGDGAMRFAAEIGAAHGEDGGEEAGRLGAEFAAALRMGARVDDQGGGARILDDVEMVGE